MNLIEQLPKTKNTFEDFRKWLFIEMDKNIPRFKKFMTYPDEFKIPFLLRYLEGRGVPVIEAFNYYAFLYPGTPSFITIMIYTIIMEFKLLETNKKINYIPF